MNSLMNNDDARDKSEFISNLDIFRQIEFFSGAPMEVIKLFAFVCQRQSYETGETIFHQDEDDGAAYFILSGRAGLMLKKAGKEYKIREVEQESFLGILSLMTPVVKTFSLVALEDVTCIVMTRKAFSRVVDQFPDIPVKVIRVLAKKLVQAEKKSIQEFAASKRDDLKPFLGISLV
ncbi:Crp/Fnr family transcriptional regulator [Desulfospira joergensenii]|uniref:Crp/Fnr family transcriptional regulator n=1 Tax=Desulfospira joergensenii TaxID=53329 RepID=UPI0009FDBAD5|nr:Crp/Fnr family transcriptional regulator [Desulfospira joergensenii]